MKRIFNNSTFTCFSPPVMIATFMIEFGLVLYTLLVRKINFSVKLVILLLIFLAVFQLSEYGICEQTGLAGSVWARIAFASITLLPPIGLHLVYSLANKTQRVLIPIVYVLAAIWIVLFVFGDIMIGQVCGGNYVVFNLNSNYDPYYFMYYNLLLLLAIWRAATYALVSKNKRVKKSLWMFVVGYLSFLIPSIIVRVINSTASAGSDTALPSIMCGFAILLALIFSLKVLPNASSKKTRK